ncbi:PAS domain S-box protein [Herbaspirillum sp. ST 5-3]|uniref:PAS domain S-box protein n=1 Tax=Oxalobacteraceae TaxID=75682 RepID=UPI0010A523B4|nr:PAS domain S-box protein [Herbaspirillum sp. ST 5-3]
MSGSPFRVLPGAAALLLGGGVLIGERLFSDWLDRHAAALSYTGLNAAVCFVLAGVALLSAGQGRRSTRTLQATLGAVILLLALAALIQWAVAYYPSDAAWRYLLNIQTEGRGRVWPGVMGVATAAAFLMCGMTLIILATVTGVASGILAQCLTAGMIGVALVGMFSGVLGNILFYHQGAGHTLINLPSAAGLAVLGVGLLFWLSDTEWYRSFYRDREDIKIFATGIALFALIALITGLTVIAIIGRYAMNSFQDSLLASFKSNVELFQSSLETAVDRSTELVAMSRLSRLVKEKAPAATLRSEIDRILKVAGEMDINALRVVGAHENLLAARNDEAYSGEFSTQLVSSVPAALYWRDGWRVRIRIPLMDDDREVGSAIVVVGLRHFDKQFERMNQLGRSGEGRVCTAEVEWMRCFPSRFSRDVTSYPTDLMPSRSRSTAMALALAGENGVAGVSDFRGNDVIAAYGQVNRMGLGLVQKIDTDEFYEPLRHQLWLALLGLMVLILAGAGVLYWRTRPLVKGLLHTRARLDAILNNVPAGVVIADDRGLIESANRTAEQMFGFDSGRLAGKHVGELLQSGTDGILLLTPGVQVLDGRRKEGDSFPSEVIASEFLLGRARRQIAIVLDITERHKMSLMLKKWADMFESVDWGVVVGDAEGKLLGQMNPAFARMHGYTVEELTGRAIAEVFAHEERATLADRIREGNEKGRHSFESMHLRKDGSTFPVWIDVTAVKDEQGRVLYRAVNVLDISERKRMEQQLRQSEHLLRKVLDSLPVGVWVVDADGKVVMTNPAAGLICDRSAPGAVNADSECKGWEPETGAPRTPCDWSIARALHDGETTLNATIEVECAGGYRKILSSSAVPLLDERGRISGAVAVNHDITRERSATEALRKSEASLANAQRIAQLGNWDSEFASGELYCSDEVFRIFGLAPRQDKPRLRAYLARVRRDDKNKVVTAIRDALNGSARLDITFHLALPDGAEKTVQAQADVVFDSAGQAASMKGIVQDISEKIAAEKLLHKRAEQFRALVENSPDVIARFDRDSHCVYANPAIEKAVGLRFCEIAGKAPDEFGLHPQVAAMWMTSIKKVFVTRLADSFDFSLRTMSGERHFQARLVPEFGPDGRVGKVLAVARDISVIKGGEAVLRESEQRLHGITTNIPGMVFQCQLRLRDNALRFTYVSEGSVPLLNLRPGQVQFDRDAIPNLIVEQDRAAFHNSLEQSARTMAVWNWEGRVMDGQDERWINCRATPRLNTSDEVVWEGVMFNISDSKRTEEKIRQSRQLLRELSAHMESVREEERKRIAREVHDELGQSLTALRMDVSMLRLNFGWQNPQLLDRIQSMTELVDRTIRIVRHVTSTLRPAALDLGLTAAIEWLVEDFIGRTGIVCMLNTDGYEVVLDDSRATALFRIVQESLMNVVKHAEASKVEISIKEEPDHVCIEVADNGKGFASESSQKPGSFGLIGIRERALMIGGTLEIHSVPGQGTRVWICIPFETQ